VVELAARFTEDAAIVGQALRELNLLLATANHEQILKQQCEAARQAGIIPVLGKTLGLHQKKAFVLEQVG